MTPPPSARAAALYCPETRLPVPAALPERSAPALPRLLLANALLLALAACGGGGSNVRPEAPAAPSPAPAPGQSNGHSGAGAGSTPVPHSGYRGAEDNLLLTTGVAQARESGLDGRDVVVGVLDAGYLGTDVHRPSAGFQSGYQDFTDAQGIDEADTPNFQHGHYITGILAGQPDATGDTAFAGGVAPGVELHWGRICDAGSCNSLSTLTALQTWADQGVALDILNLSLSATRSRTDATQYAANAWHTAFAPLVDTGTLLVISNGNDGDEHPGLPAALPVYYPEWAEKVLAVGSVRVTANGKPGELASYSNQCGDAAAWCLVAPGSLYAGALIDSSRGDGWVSGTSVSAPVVAGVAALVKQAHPWMSASNLQQTLLTTATDLGQTGVDAVYGWGAVDAARAVMGPAQLTGRFQAEVARGQDSTLANDILGSGRLEKTGEGRLVLAGDNRFAGGITVGGGTLGLAGDLSSDLQLSRGRLEALGGAIGGNFSATSGTVTSIAIGDPLQVAGTARLAGELHLRAVIDGYTPSSTETLLQADAIDGQFATVSVGSGLFYNATLAYDDHQVRAQLERTSATASASLAALPAQAIDGARVADQVLSSLPPVEGEAMPRSLTALLQADLPEASQTLRGLAASEHGIQRTLLMQTALGDLARDASRQAQAFNADASASVWAQAESGNAQYRPAGYAVTDYRQHGERIGVDLPAGDNGQLWQLSLGKQTLEGRNSDGSRFDTRQYRLAASLYQPVSLGWFAAQLGLTEGQQVSDRQQQVDAQTESLHSRYDQRLLAARLEAGIYLPHGLAPYLALGALHQRQDGFVETSASGLGLSAQAASRTVAFIEPGLRLQHRHGRWTHDAALSWRHLPGQRHLQLAGRLDGLPAVPVTTAATTLPENTVQLSLGTSWQLSGRVRAFGRLSWEQASDVEDAVNASLGVAVGF